MNDHNHDNEFQVLREYDKAFERIMRGESSDNVVMTCSECMDIVRKRGQKRLAALVTQGLQGRKVFVKVRFQDPDGTVEHMWVNVKAIKQKRQLIKGKLDSEPVMVTHVNYGDTVEVAFEDVEDVLV